MSVRCTALGLHMLCERADGQALGAAAAEPKHCCIAAVCLWLALWLQTHQRRQPLLTSPPGSTCICHQIKAVVLSIQTFDNVLYIAHSTQCICSYHMDNTYTVYVYAIYMLYTMYYILYTTYTMYAIYHTLFTICGVLYYTILHGRVLYLGHIEWISSTSLQHAW